MGERVVGGMYVLCVTLLFVAVLGQELPPCVDYPQHLALAAQARDLLLGQGGGRLVPWSYNGLFELATAIVGLALPIELAGRLVLALALVLAPVAVWRLVAFCGRPRVYAFAWFPFAYSLCFSWGFVNFVLAVSLATFTLLAWFERRSALAFVALSLATGSAHVLGVPIVVGGAVLGVWRGPRSRRDLWLLAPLLVFVAVAHATTDAAPHLPQSWDFVMADWSSRLRLTALLGSWVGSADEWLALSTGVVLLATLLVGSRGLSPRRLLESRQPFPWLSLAASGVYALGPMALFGCWFFFQRAGYVVLLWLPAVLPRLGSRRLALVQASLLVVLGSAAASNFAWHALRDDESEDARAIIAAVPNGARVIPVLDLLPGRWPSSSLHGMVSEAHVWGHFPAYAVALRGAEITWMFAREHGHFPVRLAVEDELDVPPVDYAWSRGFSADADYARRFNHVLVRTGDALEDPTSRVFGEYAGEALVLAHQGRFWLYRHVPETP